MLKPTRFKNDFIVTAAYPNKGEYEGRPYDNTKFYVKAPISKGKGYITVENVFGTSADYDRLFADVDLETSVFTIEFEQFTNPKGKLVQNIVGVELKKETKTPFVKA